MSIVWDTRHPNLHDERLCPCYVCERARSMDTAIAEQLEAEDREKGPYTHLRERVEFGVVAEIGGMVAIHETFIHGLYKYGVAHDCYVRYDYVEHAWSVRGCVV